ncbi:putative bifunctional diguanylate cyclase/phosphodiesterase [Cohnella cellulosilytica]|uniref:Bifunctional diguanylate cyclase/phosphodiesterase n=1 Tax=Cohnella cellulosilytica TaxID=986710 RepID=A0ABW2FF85_9BACL
MTKTFSITDRFAGVPPRIWIILACATLLLGGLISYLAKLYRDDLVRETHRDTAYELSAYASALSAAIESRLLLTNGVKAFVVNELAHGGAVSESRFRSFAADFMNGIPGIRNFSIYPDGIATLIYPAEGNDNVLGMDLFHHPDPEIRSNAERTMRTERMTVLGPRELTQSGLGLLSRQSVYYNDRFWGFVSAVLDIDPILQEVDLYNGDKGINFAVRANSLILMGDPQLFEETSIIKKLELSDGEWEMAAVPNREKLESVAAKSRIFQAVCAGSLLLLLYFLYVQLTQQARLQQLVAERTHNLEIANKTLESTFAQLSVAAYRDVVTGLNNRTYFNEQLEQKIESNRQSGDTLALLYLDLDHFKMINDSYGHLYGDMMLREVGKRLVELSLPEAEISRIGGDEFTVILPRIANMEQLRQIAHQVRELFQTPFPLRDTEHFMTTSIGIALFPMHAQNSADLIRNADLAMYRAKDEGKNLFRIYDVSLNPNAEETMEIKNSLRVALDKDEFMVYYQPQIEVRSGKIVGLEALIRWKHTKRGMIPPSSFIPIAEETGMIVPIGERVLRLVCAQSRAWQQAGLPPIRIAVNLSARQFAQKNLPARIGAILDEYDLDPRHIELEITENLAMKEDMQPALHTLRDRGFTISIDDFGTQYSSLNYLKLLPVDKIKIDRSFVSGIARERKDEAIIVAMLLIARRLNLTVIAEGVETSEQLAFLEENECHEIQGFIFSKPRPAEQIADLLARNVSLEAPTRGL